MASGWAKDGGRLLSDESVEVDGESVKTGNESVKGGEETPQPMKITYSKYI